MNQQKLDNSAANPMNNALNNKVLANPKTLKNHFLCNGNPITQHLAIRNFNFDSFHYDFIFRIKNKA